MGLFDKLAKKAIKKGVKEFKKSIKKPSSTSAKLNVNIQSSIDKNIDDIETQFEELNKKGFSENEIKENILEELGSKKDEPEFEWVLGECKLTEQDLEFCKDEGIELKDGKYCPDCVSRSGETGTMDFWRTVGKPKSGWSICGEGCGCRLKRVGR